MNTLIALLRRWRARCQHAQLHAMSDRELADLGIGRSEIPAVLAALPRPRLREN